MEHRWGYRFSCDVDVKVSADPALAGRGRVRNISISGGFIETTLRVAPLAVLRLTRAGSVGYTPEVVSAVVVRRDKDGLGVEWLDGEADGVVELIQESRANRPRLSPHVLTAWIGK